MAIKKSELYSSLWKSCEELRGGMDASQYKDYVLVLLFVNAGQPNALIEVPEGGSFTDMVVLKSKKEIGDQINKIIARLAEGDDILGDAYEYLMRHFATESGKSK
jgi:type I restriction enzyme M protein